MLIQANFIQRENRQEWNEDNGGEGKPRDNLAAQRATSRFPYDLDIGTDRTSTTLGPARVIPHVESTSIPVHSGHA